MTDADRVLIVAGEASADAHAAALVRELKALRPGLEVYGAGGAALRAAGVELLFDFSSAGVVGAAEVLPNLGRFIAAYRALVRSAQERRPTGVILVDLPDFNLFLARKLRQVRPLAKIIYYISPQVWAWRPGRVKTIARRADAMLVLFPFETEIYRKAGMDVEFVGHPLLDSARASAPAAVLRAEFGLADSGPVIALLPGSRRSEVQRYLPEMARATLQIAQERPATGFLLARAATVSEDLIEKHLGQARSLVRVVPGRVYDVLAAADLALVASGTATLETAIMGTPLIILGAVSWPNYLPGRLLIRVSSFGLPNVIAGRLVAPELLQSQARAGRILATVRELLEHPARMATMKEELAAVKNALGRPGASRRAAAAVARRLWPELEPGTDSSEPPRDCG